jgi:D-arabinose 1-dehydrogenase-like Zn-dependent alcohol dehydrogenase
MATINVESIDTLCMACSDEKCDFKPILLKRRAMGDEDLEITMKFCGVCHRFDYQLNIKTKN